ncbi:PHP domain-containing protein [Demequina sp. NBRC 110057]|uniref:PHP domain-containing protein n=1 Tax=Demequina sp. NBRC 110057 TaxID=1570346 RepID=UPI000A03BB26|nr:PHP domain-containing protein [Demequina sp. NBRC 110057]
MRIDLHTHSTVSDGTGTPAQVMREAAEAGLDVVALTDHDSILGWEEASAEADAVGVRFVPGIEVSCKHRGISIHLLSYWHDRADADVRDMLALTREARVHRARAIVDVLAADFPLTWGAVADRAGAATVGRPHIADALVDLGVVPTRDAAFDRILAPGSRYYVPHFAPEVTAAVATMRRAGGVTVFAHPGATARGRVVGDAVVAEMAHAGLVGVEVDHRDHDDAQRGRLGALADGLGLVRTGASDYHGTGKRNRLGENLTSPAAFAALEAARQR